MTPSKLFHKKHGSLARRTCNLLSTCHLYTHPSRLFSVLLEQGGYNGHIVGILCVGQLIVDSVSHNHTDVLWVLIQQLSENEQYKELTVVCNIVEKIPWKLLVWNEQQYTCTCKHICTLNNGWSDWEEVLFSFWSWWGSPWFPGPSGRADYSSYRLTSADPGRAWPAVKILIHVNQNIRSQAGLFHSKISKEHNN